VPVRRPALLLALAAALLAAACTTSHPAPAPKAAAAPAAGSGIDLTALDRAVAPGDAFYEFANGAWLARTEIPPERSYTGAAMRVIDVVGERSRAIVEEAARAGGPPGSPAQLIGDFFASYMDEAAIEAAGLAPLRPTLARLAAVADKKALAAELGSQLRADVDGLNATDLYTDRPLGFWVEQDLDDPSRAAPYLLQGGLGMPDRDYYLAEGERMAKVRDAYRAHLARSLALAGVADVQAVAGRVFDLEVKLARTHATRTEAGDVAKANHRWLRAELPAKAPGLDWDAFLAAAGLEGQPYLKPWHPGAVTGLAALVASEPLATWREYLAARAVERAAPVLPRAFVEERFAFYGTTLSGTTQMLPRWKRAIAATDGALGEAVGRLYVARHFPPEEKRELEEMVANITAAFGRRIDALDWMAPATRAKAREKLAVLRVSIAYPDAWRDWSGLRIVRGDPLGNAERAGLFEYRRNLAKLGKPIDRGEWCMRPHEVNAVNLPARNLLQFPAGYLEAPLYDRGATAAIKYGTIGMVIGHEISHSFDDQGAQFDAAGRLRNWWTDDDLAHFGKAGAALVRQYDAYRPFPDLAVNGQLTLSENIADLAGLAAAFDGWQASLRGAPAPVVDGLTGEQQFFLGYAQANQIKEREQALRSQILTDGHSPEKYRVLTVRNLDAWYAAFGVKAGQALFLAPEERVRVW
jgi:putative endopeptidase